MTLTQLGVTREADVPAAVYDTTTALGKLRTQITSQAKEWARFQFHRLYRRAYDGSDMDKSDYTSLMKSGWGRVYKRTGLTLTQYKKPVMNASWAVFSTPGKTSARRKPMSELKKAHDWIRPLRRRLRSR